MTVEDLLRRGGECEAAGDLEAAEQAFREADELHDAEGAILLGLVLKRRGDLRGAADAFRRAEARGHPEAASSLGNLLWDNDDVEGAKAAYERSAAAGSADAGLNLGLLLAQQGAVDEALRYLHAAEETDSATASWAIGKLLEGRDDLRGAEAAYRRAAEAGNANAAYSLGSLLMKLEDVEGGRAAFQRAQDLGHDGAAHILQLLDQQAGAVPNTSTNQEANVNDATADPAMETAVKWAQLYAAACGEVYSASDACLEVTNRAVRARAVADQRPQAEVSIRRFTEMAEESEQRFGPLYRAFAEACANARDTAANFLSAQTVHDPEIVLILNVPKDVADTVAGAKAILRTNYGPTPAGFIDGVLESNALMENPFPEGGNIYTPPPPAQSDERTCPWCAETIKAAAVICRFCGRDVQVQPNAG